MRRPVWLGMALAACLGGAAARGQEQKVPYTATVTAAEAEVRAGAGDSTQLYPTNRLRKGDTVEVLKVMEGGWLGIRPPAGSFSWVNTRFVQRNGNTMNYVVTCPMDVKVPLLMGTNYRTDKPTVEGAKVTRGTILRGRGWSTRADDGDWVAVEPPPLEIRYLRAEAVAPQTGKTVAAASPPTPPGAPDPTPGSFGAPTPPGAEPPAPPTGNGPHPLLVKGQQLEQVGQYAEAIRTYQQLGAQVASTDHALSMQALNRAQQLSDSLARVSSRNGPAGTSGNAATPPAGLPAGHVSSGPGWLRRAGRTLDYSTLYILENSQGIPIVYATAMPGYSLDSYANKNVELIGPRQFRSDLRAYHMTAMQVRPLR